MSKYIVRYLVRTRDGEDAHNVMFNAFGVHDALARFTAWQRRHHPYDSIDIIAVWSDADCELRARRKGAA